MNQQQQPSILTCQIIAGAMYMGVVIFAGIAFVIQSGRDAADAEPGELPILLIVAAVFTVTELAARQFVLMVYDRKLKEEIRGFDPETDSTDRFLALYQTRLIVTMAMLEGGAFLGVVVYLIEGHWGGLAIAGFLLMLMAFGFPTESKFREWIRKHSGHSAYAGDESL